jgi:hypothetical protein
MKIDVERFEVDVPEGAYGHCLKTASACFS